MSSTNTHVTSWYTQRHSPALAGENLNVLIFLREVDLTAINVIEGHCGAGPVDLNFQIFGVDGFNGREHTAKGASGASEGSLQ